VTWTGLVLSLFSALYYNCVHNTAVWNCKLWHDLVWYCLCSVRCVTIVYTTLQSDTVSCDMTWSGIVSVQCVVLQLCTQHCSLTLKAVTWPGLVLSLFSALCYNCVHNTAVWHCKLWHDQVWYCLCSVLSITIVYTTTANRWLYMVWIDLDKCH